MSQQQQQLQQRLHELQREEARIQQQLAVQTFAAQYPIQLQWPALVQGNARTDPELIQHRLLEAGLLYDVPMPMSDAVTAAQQFIANLEATDCFHTVQVELGKAGAVSEDNETQRTVHVTLQEKNWYRLHAGAGLKTDFVDQYQVSTNSFLPTAELEVSLGLRNLAGCLDRTELLYGMDTHQMGTWKLSHTRPLYQMIPHVNLANLLLEQENGSQYAFTSQLALDTVDFEYVSSFKLYQRYLSLQIASNAYSASQPQQQQQDKSSWEWLVKYRDLCPRRHATRPYRFQAAPEIVQHSGSSVKHSLIHKWHVSTAEVDPGSAIPIAGTQWQWTNEVATPPGDVGFIKSQLAWANHLPISSKACLHTSVHTGYLHPLSFGGLCDVDRNPADSFLLGGVGSFRGFVPAGIGPRSATTKDALGGNFMTTATLLLSTKVTSLPALEALTQYIRLFGFVQAGTCANVVLPSVTPLSHVWNSTRVSAGMGIATQAFGPRVEMTYAWPLRYGPKDGRRRFQVGVSFSI